MASCAHIFMALNRYDRARDYLMLQSGTEYQTAGEVEILLREGKDDAALQNLKLLPGKVYFYGRPLLEPCLVHRTRTAGEAVGLQKFGAGIMSDSDPFPKYFLAGWYSLCDQPDLAYSALRRALAENYCVIRRWKQTPCWPKFARCRSLPKYARQVLRASSAFWSTGNKASRNETVLPEELVWGGNKCEAHTAAPLYSDEDAKLRWRKTAPSLTPALRTPIRVIFSFYIAVKSGSAIIPASRAKRGLSGPESRSPVRGHRQ